MMIDMALVDTLNRSNVSDMEKTGDSLDPKEEGSREIFGQKVSMVQGALIHTYAILSLAAIRERNPKDAAAIWCRMTDFCDVALKVLSRLKEKFPLCGTPELYNLALDYKNAAEERYRENLQDSECLKMPIPPGLFPKKN
jgi:hypothetical protein